jgi:uncharacterized protein DUF1559
MGDFAGYRQLDESDAVPVRRGTWLRLIPSGVEILSAVGVLWLFPVISAATVFVIAIVVWHLVSDLKQERLSSANLARSLLVGAGLFVFGVLCDAIPRIKQAAERTQSANNLKAIALALHTYQDKNGKLPPVAMRSADGRPLLSWRVAILPYLESEYLYKQFKLDEPWDGPHNRLLLHMAPTEYRPVPYCRATGDNSTTFYQLFVGPRAAFERNSGLRIPADFPGGVQKTILVVETREAVPWTRPGDIPFGEDEPPPELGMPSCRRIGRLEFDPEAPLYFQAAMVDGTVRFFPTAISPEKLRHWIDRTAIDKPEPELGNK